MRQNTMTEMEMNRLHEKINIKTRNRLHDIEYKEVATKTIIGENMCDEDNALIRYVVFKIGSIRENKQKSKYLELFRILKNNEDILIQSFKLNQSFHTEKKIKNIIKRSPEKF